MHRSPDPARHAARRLLALPGRLARAALLLTLSTTAALLALPVAAAETPPPDARIAVMPIDPGGWRYATLPEGSVPGVSAESLQFIEITGRTGVALAPIPEPIREDLVDELAASPDPDRAAFSINVPIANAIEASLAQGSPTPELLAFVAQDPGSGGGIDSAGPGARFAAKRSCSDQSVGRTLPLKYTPRISQQWTLADNFTGSLALEGGGTVDAQGSVEVRLRRARVFWLCVPYGVRFDHARIVGTVTLENTATLSGTLRYDNPELWKTDIAKPELGGVGFLIGPVPVYIGFNLPIIAGLELEASATGDVQYRGGLRASGRFDYFCTASQCTGWNDVQSSQTVIDNPWGAGVSGRIKPSLYAEVAIRAYLYTDALAYAQVGVRPYLKGDLWGYYGNTCGDAEEDGHFETVSALTFDLNAQVKIKAKADVVFSRRPWESTLWESSEWHLGFWDLVGSSALTPMVGGPARTDAGRLTAYSLKMRPCWPYSDDVDYSVQWGDGSTSDVTGPASPPAWQSVLASHAWGAPGTYPLQVTALRDGHGRAFGSGRTTARSIEVGAAAGNVNLARSASASATSTFCWTPGTLHCYDAARTNDGDTSTAVGGFTSWANAEGSGLPQSVELLWPAPVLFQRVVVYTTDGYAMRDFDVEVWTGAGWQAVASARGNVLSRVELGFAPVQAFRLRVVGRSGPNAQPSYVRINEIEVY